VKKSVPAILVLFVLSGFCGLVYQVAWLRMLTLTFGSTVYAVSTLLTAFMGGLALGSAVIGRLTPRIRRPLLVYGLLELVIGLYGLSTPWMFKTLDGLYILIYQHFTPGASAFAALRFVMAMVILIIPTMLMGGTLPVLARFVIRKREQAGAGAGILYFANTAGAVLGCFTAGFVLIPLLGLRMAILVAAVLNGLVFVFAAMLSRRFGEPLEPVAAAPAPAPASPPSSAPALSGDEAVRRLFFVFFFLTGMASLAYEVYWTRILVLYLGSSVYAFSVMLVVLLFGLALGSLICAPLSDRLRPAGLAGWFGAVELGIGLAILVQVQQFKTLSETMGNMGLALGAPSYTKMIIVFFFATAQVILIPTVLMGASFPLAAKAVSGSLRSVGRDLGDLYGVNTLGAIVGSFAGGFILIPLLGVQWSMGVTAALNVAVGGVALVAARRGKGGMALLAPLPIILVLGYVFLFNGLYPMDQVLTSAGVFNHRGISRVVHFEEDAQATITVEEVRDTRGDWRSISLNGVNVAGTAIDLLAVQKLQGHLPLLVHGDARSVLHIGFGSGGTAHAVSKYPDVEHIRVAEISPGVIRTSARYFEEVNHRFWLEDERVKITYCDGRNFILASPQTFDVILSDSIHPRYAGNGSLYTKEYYELCRSKLNPGGVVSQWLPFYSLTDENLRMIFKSFQAVFPETYVFYVNSTINPFTVVLGRVAGEKIDVARMAELLAIPSVRTDLEDIGQTDPVRILDNFLFGREALERYVQGVPFHTDDWPAVEYFSSRLLSRTWSWRDNFDVLLGYRQPVIPLLDWGGMSEEERLRITAGLQGSYEATGHNLAGQLLVLQGEQEPALEEFAEALRLGPDDEEPWEYTRFYLAGRGFPAGM
jgi:spermidine synthase